MLLRTGYDSIRWALLFTWIILSVTGSPLHSSPPTEDWAPRPQSGKIVQIPGQSIWPKNDIVHLATSRGLEKRVNDLSLTHATNFQAIIPVQLAAQSLKVVYKAVIFKVSQEWRSLAPTSIIDISIGDLTLSMLSNQPISWDFVTDFCDKMVVASTLGFANTYDMMYENPLANVAISVILRLYDSSTGLEARSLVQRNRAPPKMERLDKRTRSSIAEPPPAKGHINGRLSKSSFGSRSAAEGFATSRPFVEARTIPLSHPTKNFALQKFRATAIITPVVIAARYLEDFYDLIALKVETGFWSAVPPMHSLVLKRWNYALTFFCYAAPVPWEFIQEVAIDMSSWAEKGFTAQFDAVYKSVDALGREIFVSVGMKLIEGNGMDETIHT